MQDAIPLYSVPRGSERGSVEQAEYAAIKPKERKVSSVRPPHQIEKLNASPNRESQEGLQVYAKPDLSKKKKHRPSLLSTSNESPPPIPPRIEDD